jgi:two-component sensor histidine kinase
MLTAPAQSTAVPAPADDHETACREQTAHLDEKGFRPINGLLVLGELPAGVMGVTTVSALLSPISGSTQVPFHGHLRDLCDDLAATFGRSGGPRLTCVAAHAALPIGAGTMLALVVDLLVADAFVHAFPPGRGGRIAVSFTADQEAWQLTVDDSGIAVRSDGDPRDNGLAIARLFVVRLGGQLEIPSMIGGTRCILTLPRPQRKRIDFGHLPTTAAISTRATGSETETVPLC